MQSSQVACPHCGSTLTFGTDIGAGAGVNCLICMRPFVVEKVLKPVAVNASPTSHRTPPSGTASQKPAKSDSKPTPKPRSKPAPSDVQTAVLQKTIVDQPKLPATNRFGLFAAMLGFFFFLIGGGVFAFWKLTPSAKTDLPPGPDAEVVAVAKAAEAPVIPKKPSDDTAIKIGPSTVQTKKAVSVEPPEDEHPKPKAANTVLPRRENKKPIAIEPETKDVAVAPSAPKYKAFGLTHDNINATVDKAIEYLKKTQESDGSWKGPHKVGYAAIGGLTMLECNIPRDDPAVTRAANFVRGNIAKLNFTYEMSLAILFLDRLGDPRDRVRIQGLALRLLAGQCQCGGWDYDNRLLDPQEMHQLYAFLRSRNPTAPKDSPRIENKEPIKEIALMAPNSADAFDPFQQLYDLVSKKNKVAKGGNPVIRMETLSPNLQSLQVVQLQGKTKNEVKFAGPGKADNSNTQFALLALWTARRHDVPTDQAILLAYQRFQNSIEEEGGWRYYPRRGDRVTATMTCVGLLGLALGHGVAPEKVADADNPELLVVKPALQDPNIQKGLKFLANFVGEPVQTKETVSLGNLYLLWSIERVAVLYDLKTVEGKDWYAWGAQMLVFNQTSDGAWKSNLYHGSTNHINTCFALLFLKRSNLVKDLTVNLRLQSGIRSDDR